MSGTKSQPVVNIHAFLLNSLCPRAATEVHIPLYDFDSNSAC